MKKGMFLALTLALAVTAAAVGGATTEGSAAPAASAAANKALIKCGKTRQIGIAAPITGPAASLGAQQLNWARFFVQRYNRSHRRTQLRLVQGDTRLGTSVSEAVRAAQFLSNKSAVLGVVGPAGSQEVQATTPVFRGKGVGFVSGSATRTDLTNGERRGFFFRVVPPDSVQGTTVARYIVRTLKARRVWVIDDQESYGRGLGDTVQARLRAAGVTVTRESVRQNQPDFSSLVARIPANTQVIYIPWQLSQDAQRFGQQLRAQGKGRITLFGSDGLFDPANFRINGAYVSFFPVSATNPAIAAYKRTHRGKPDFFGAPTYVATQVVARAIDRACRNGTATRREVRSHIARTRIRRSLLGLPVRFTRNGDIRGGQFGIFRIVKGVYTPVG